MEKIILALKHIQSFYPSVCMVVYNKDGQWQFMDENFDAPSFTSNEVDISILEEAADSVPTLPFVYQE